jgi:hypothetical protein
LLGCPPRLRRLKQGATFDVSNPCWRREVVVDVDPSWIPDGRNLLRGVDRSGEARGVRHTQRSREKRSAINVCH